MEVSEVVPSRSKLHSLLISEFNHIGVTAIKEPVIQFSKETLAEAFELVFRAVNTGMNNAFISSWRWV